MEDKKKLYILDGSSLLSTYFYATAPKELYKAKTEEERENCYKLLQKTKNGVYVNGVYGCLNFINKLVKYEKPDFLMVAFDKSRNTFRRKLYEPYKGNRKETVYPLKQQFITLENVLKELGVCVLFGDDYEADDYAASVAKQYESESINVTIITKDKDFLQLPSKYTKCGLIQPSIVKAEMLNSKYSKAKSAVFDKIFEFGPEEVKKEEGVYPWQIPDLKALVGDSSDNYPGVKGIRAAAVPLLNEYETIETLYNVIGSCYCEADVKSLLSYWKENLNVKPTTYTNLLRESDDSPQGKDAAFLFKKIATMKTDIDLNISLEDMKISWSKENIDMVRNELEREQDIER